MSSPINVTGKANFEELVLKESLPVLVDFWAPWCGPCQMMAPVLDGLATAFDGRVKIIKVDTDQPDNQQLAIEYGIQSIPNMKLFKEGKVIKDFIGYRPQPAFEDELKQVLGL